MIGKTVGAIACVALTVTLWVVCLRLLLGYARHGDPGAYVMVAGVFLLLPFGAVVCIVGIARERSGYWDSPQAARRNHIARHTPQYATIIRRETAPHQTVIDLHPVAVATARVRPELGR